MNQTVENKKPFIKEQIAQLINGFNEKGIEQIFEYAAFLKFRTHIKDLSPQLAEFSESEHKFNELGMNVAKKQWNKSCALEAMKKLKGSGNGQLIAALLNERQKERLKNG
ncbi:hypothetical protein [Candidatus Parabeggiatoa sp. HSG14]|uniref:hypothetical protein n=1 Tax=Candidatus Parabeggiatoa sp. HSG14 TaxID=3055593 RepID=UPI0025A77161|nr:hypothetical protein [Thiotrichales bacterium HSG14]